MAKEIDELVEKYWGQVEVESAGYEQAYVNPPISYDPASLVLVVPRGMLQEFSQKRGKKQGLPDPVEFWKETKLLDRLRRFDKTPHGSGISYYLKEVLDYLEGEVDAEYQELNNSDLVRLTISEPIET